MADIFTGAALPNVTTTTTGQQTAPDWYTDFMKSLSSTGQAQLGKTSDQLVAGLSPLQQQAFSGAANLTQAGQPSFGTAQGALGQLATGVSGQDISQFFNPYQSAVMDEMARRSEQNVQRNLMPQMKAAFAGSGGFGSQRYAGAMGQALGDVQANLAGQQAGLAQSGFNTALDAAMRQKGLMGQAAQIGGQLGTQQQNAMQNALATQSQLGAQQQAYEQAKLSAPLQNALNTAQLMRGFQVPTGQTQTTTGPGQQGQFQLSPLQQLAGLGSLIGAVGSGGIGDKLGGLFDWIKTKFPDLGNTPSTVDSTNKMYQFPGNVPGQSGMYGGINPGGTMYGVPSNPLASTGQGMNEAPNTYYDLA